MRIHAYRIVFFCLMASIIFTGSLHAQTAEQSQFDFANGLFSHGYYKDAATEYRSYLKDYPEAPQRETAMYRLGESLYAQKNFPGALEAFQQLKKLYPESAFLSRSQLREGISLYRVGQLKKALPFLIDTVGRESDIETKGEALYYLGKLYTDSKDWPSAIQAFERLSKEAQDSSYSLFGEYQLAVVYVGQERFEAAALLFISIGDKASGSPVLQMDSLYRAGETYDKLGWHEAAGQSYKKLKERFPDSKYAREADYGLSWSLYRAGDYDGAIGTIDAFIKQYPDSPLKGGLDYLKGNCFLKKKDYAKAEALFQQVTAQYPNTTYAHQAQYKMAISLMEHGGDEAAKQLLIPLTRTASPTAATGDATFLLAKLYMDAKEYSEASLQLLRVVEQFPNSEFSVESLYKLGECYALNGDLTKSAETFENFARLHKSHSLALEAVFHSADAYFQLGDFEQALVRFEHVSRDTAIGRFREEALYRMAISYHNLSNSKASVDAFTHLLKAFPASLYASEAHYRIADHLLYESNNAVEAIEHFKIVAQQSPSNNFTGKALKGIAVSHFSMKDFDGAVEMFYRVITEHVSLSLQADTYEWAGQYLFDRNQWQKSADIFSALIERVPEYPSPERIYFKLGEAYSAMNKVDKALAAYSWIEKNALQTPSAHEAIFGMAWLYEKQGKAEEAMALFERAATVAMNDTAAQARFHLGELFEQKKEYETAAKNYMRVAILFLHPTLSPESMWRAGQCFEKGENRDSAIRTYTDIVTEYPDSKQAENARARLADLKA